MRENIRQTESDWMAEAAIKSMPIPSNEQSPSKKELYSTDESPKNALDRAATSMADIEAQKIALKAEQAKQRELEKVRKELEAMKQQPTTMH